jgi:hypothetical protein
MDRPGGDAVDAPHGDDVAKPGIEGLRALEARRRSLVRMVAEHGRDAAKLAGVPGGFYVEPVDFNAIRAADLSALSQIASELGEPAVAVALERHADEVRRAIRDRMPGEAGGVLRAHDLPGADETRSGVDHAGKFILLFGRCLPDGQAVSLAAGLRDPDSGYAAPYPVPSVPLNAPTFDGDDSPT